MNKSIIKICIVLLLISTLICTLVVADEKQLEKKDPKAPATKEEQLKLEKEKRSREAAAEKRAKQVEEKAKEAQEKKEEIEKEMSKGAEACFQDKSKSTEQQRKCADEKGREAAEKLGKKLTDVELKKMQQEGGRKEAAKIVKNCTEKATTREEKMACRTSKAAKEACFKSNGGYTCTDTDLMEGAEDDATENTQKEMSKCARLNTTKEKTKCRSDKTSDIRAIIDAAGLGNAESIKDSDVKEYIRRGAENAISNSISVCNSTDLQTCYDDAKQMFKDASGDENATDYDFERSANSGKKNKVAEDMKACKRNAGSDKQKLADCRKLAKSSMKQNSLDGKEPTEAEVENFLSEAAGEAVKKAKVACRKTSNKTVCDALAMDIIAATKGKDAKDVTKFERKEVEEKAAISSAVDNARDCLKARKDNATATCKDPFDAYTEVSSKAEPTDEKKKKLAKEKLKVAALKNAVKEARKVCLEKGTKEEGETCLTQAKTDEDEVSEILFPGKDAEARKKKREIAEKEANIDVLGSVFGACMKTAGSDKSKKDACMTELNNKKDKLGESEDTKKLLKRARTNLLIEPAEACDGADLKSCREAAKEAAKDAGMPEKEYAQTKKLAEVKGAANTWAACSDSGSTDSECDDVAKEKFVEISGSVASAYEEKPTPDAKQTVKERVKKMGKAIKDGKETKLYEKKKVIITIVTSGTKCDKKVIDEFKENVEKMRNSAKATAEQKKISGVAKPSCRVVDDQAEYNTAADTKDLKTADEYDKVTTDSGASLASLKYKTTTRRRLLLTEVSTTSSYAAQDVTECVADDTECQEDASIEDTSSSEKNTGSLGTSDALSFGSRSAITVIYSFIGSTILFMLY